VQLHKARAEAVKREAELIEQRDARGEPSTFQELKRFVESYNTVRASLDRCLSFLEVLPPPPPLHPPTTHPSCQHSVSIRLFD
jgi:hypothetical protein